MDVVYMFIKILPGCCLHLQKHQDQHKSGILLLLLLLLMCLLQHCETANVESNYSPSWLRAAIKLSNETKETLRTWSGKMSELIQQWYCSYYLHHDMKTTICTSITIIPYLPALSTHPSSQPCSITEKADIFDLPVTTKQMLLFQVLRG